jgi:hypothetical protein
MKKIEVFINSLREEREVILASLRLFEHLARLRGRRGRPSIYRALPNEGGTSRLENRRSRG